MASIMTENGVVKYDDTTHSAVKIENDVIVGKGNTIIAKSDSKWVYWDKFNKPSSLCDYGKNALDIILKAYASDYWIKEGVDSLYYDSASKNLTKSAVGNEPAKLDLSSLGLFDSNYPALESIFKYTEDIVLKGIDVLVSCGGINEQSVIDTGEADLNAKKEMINRDCSLIDNCDNTKLLAVFNAIKDEELIGTNFNAVCSLIEGA